jgi:hypothetical protein
MGIPARPEAWFVHGCTLVKITVMWMEPNA